MITTITLNPSVDKRYMVDNFHKNGIFRIKDMAQTAGGKGLNAARVVKLLGEPVIASGLTGGKNEEIIKEELNELEIINRFIKIKGETRNCIAILSDDSSQTEILEPGPLVTEKEINEFLYIYDEILEDSTIICASGSIPENVPVDIYKELIERAKINSIPFLLDTSGRALKEGIKASPYMIKPNRDELMSLTDMEINSEKDIIKRGKRLIESGIEVVVISLGGEGSMIFHGNKIYKVLLPKVHIINPVGSGDSMIAGFAVGLKRGYNFEEMIKFASAVGTANAMEKETGVVSKKIVNDLTKRIKIKEIKNY